MRKIIANTYEQVIGYIKLAHEAKRKIRVERMGNDFVGIYWEIYLD